MTEAQKSKSETTAEDRQNADQVASWHPLSQLPYEKRLQHAKNFGPNWASILSGLGDQ